MKTKVIYANVDYSLGDSDDSGLIFVYCSEKGSGYCFSLCRFEGDDNIEVMVLEQINTKVFDLEVKFNGKTLEAYIPSEIANKLDAIDRYIVHLDITEEERESIVETLEKIFEGKSGLSII